MSYQKKYLKYKEKYLQVKNNQFGGSSHLNAPLYVTIGPPNAGKSTKLREIHDLIDVAIDDDPEVWKNIPLEVIDNLDESSEYTYHGIKLKDRLERDTNNEQVQVYKYFTNKITLKQFINRLKMEEEDLLIFIPVICKLKLLNIQYSCHFFSVYIEEVFHPSSGELFAPRKALNRLEQELASKSMIPIAWGQTNFDINHYNKFLDLAIKYERPIRFLLWGRDFGERRSSEIENLNHLVERNIIRFLKNGNYAPFNSIKDKLKKINIIINKYPNDENFEKTLLNDIGYDINSQSLVSKME
jgi:hypothetical protein